MISTSEPLAQVGTLTNSWTYAMAGKAEQSSVAPQNSHDNPGKKMMREREKGLSDLFEQPNNRKKQQVIKLLSDRGEDIRQPNTLLAIARERMKPLVEKHHLESSFKTGSGILLKLQPYLQQYTQARASLNNKFLGPYQILEIIAPDSEVLNSLLQMYGCLGQIAKKEQVLPATEKRHCLADMSTTNILILVYESERFLDIVENSRQSLAKNKMRLVLGTRTSRLRVYSKKKPYTYCFGIFKKQIVVVLHDINSNTVNEMMRDRGNDFSNLLEQGKTRRKLPMTELMFDRVKSILHQLELPTNCIIHEVTSKPMQFHPAREAQTSNLLIGPLEILQGCICLHQRVAATQLAGHLHAVYPSRIGKGTEDLHEARKNLFPNQLQLLYKSQETQAHSRMVLRQGSAATQLQVSWTQAENLHPSGEWAKHLHTLNTNSPLWSRDSNGGVLLQAQVIEKGGNRLQVQEIKKGRNEREKGGTGNELAGNEKSKAIQRKRKTGVEKQGEHVELTGDNTYTVLHDAVRAGELKENDKSGEIILVTVAARKEEAS